MTKIMRVTGIAVIGIRRRGGELGLFMAAYLIKSRIMLLYFCLYGLCLRTSS